MPGFCQQLRREADPIWRRILSHPFLGEMTDATLPLDKFRFYIGQDYAFIIDFCRCLAMAAARAQDIKTMQTFASLLNGSLTTEMQAIRGLCTRIGLPAEPPPSAPTNTAYTRHMLYVSDSGSLGEIAVVLLPCAWSYQEIGEKLSRSQKISKQPFYAEWTATYASKEYADLVGWHRGLVDDLARRAGSAEKERMRSHFMLSSRYEYMFWDMAYNLEKWPV